MADVKQWITVHPNGKENKGQPIPVMEGQSKGEAVKSFVESKTGKEYRQNTSYEEIQGKHKELENTNIPDSVKDKLWDRVEHYKNNSEFKRNYIVKGKIDYDRYYEDNKGVFKTNWDEKTGNNVLDYVKGPQERYVRINGKHPEFVKKYALTEVWLYPSQYGGGYYFSMVIDGKREYITVDSNTANSKHWASDYNSLMYDGDKSYKVSANGYLYVDKKGKARYSIKDNNNIDILKTYNKWS